MTLSSELPKELVRLTERVRAARGLPPVPTFLPMADLRRDLGLDSLDLAELTVRIQHRYEVDVFASGVVRTWGELVQRVQEHVARGRKS
jgi:acyl carrier protein